MAEGITHWGQLLHFYQPPTQAHDVLKRVVEESYRPVLGVLGDYPAARLAVNMNGVLTRMLVEHGFGDVVTSLAALAERGQIEFVGSGQHHPILPLIPEQERQRSIAEHAATNRALIGESYRPTGFFPPELCYSIDILPAVLRAGHDWLLLSGIASPDGWPTDAVSRIATGGRSIAVLFRDDVRSNRISFRETSAEIWVDELADMSGDGQERYVMTAMDAETFGHHIRGWDQEFLAETFGRLAEEHDGRVRMTTPGELVRHFPVGPLVEPLRSSWSTSQEDIDWKNPYPLWQDPGNAIHALQWELVDHCLHLVGVARTYATTTEEARRFAAMAGDTLQPALHSCQFWWASRRPWWDVPMVQPGVSLLANVLIYAARAVDASTAPASVKRETHWRLAAARDARRTLEQHLIEDPRP